MKFGMSVRSALVAPLALGVMMVGTAQVARAQTPPPAQPTQQPATPPATPPAAAQAAPAAAENPTFSAPAGLLLVQIKPDKTADYEAMITKLKDALTKSEKPERKAMAKAWKVYKAGEPAPGGNTLYVHVIEAAAPGDYTNPLRIISEVFPTEVQDIYTKVKEGFVQTGLLNLTLLTDLSGTPATGAAQP
jgi:hypothetical protein